MIIQIEYTDGVRTFESGITSVTITDDNTLIYYDSDKKEQVIDKRGNDIYRSGRAEVESFCVMSDSGETLACHVKE